VLPGQGGGKRGGIAPPSGPSLCPHRWRPRAAASRTRSHRTAPASPLVRDIVVAAHDLAHLGLGQRPPADLHHLAAADVAHPAILLDAQQEVRGDVAVLVLHHTTGALAAVSALKVLTKHSGVCASIAPAEGLGGSKKPWPGGEVEK
jgi:hypothetical protein